MNKLIAGGITEILRIEKELLSQMLRSLRKASELIKHDDTEAFEKELVSCESIMKSVDELRKSEERLQSAEAAGGDEARQLKTDIAYIIKQISDANTECAKASEDRLKSCASQIKALRQSKQGMDLYTNEINHDAVFIDAKQ